MGCGMQGSLRSPSTACIQGLSLADKVLRQIFPVLLTRFAFLAPSIPPLNQLAQLLKAKHTR